MVDNFGLPDELSKLIDTTNREFSKIEVKVERRKYGKFWAVVSGIEASSKELKEILKKIKTKMACAGTIKKDTIEVLYGKTEKNRQLIEALLEQGFSRDSIHIISKK